MNQRRRILLIDDSQDFRFTVEMRLQAEGFDVTTAASGREGLEAAANQTFDLILLDMIMPEMDGVTIYHELRAKPHTRTVPVILLTGVAVEGHWEPMPSETDRLVFIMGKPHDYTVLLARIHQLLTQGSDA